MATGAEGAGATVQAVVDRIKQVGHTVVRVRKEYTRKEEAVVVR